MHFRNRGKSIQLVRTTYDASTKRPKTEVMGRLSPPKFELTDDIKEKLTAEELEEVTAYSTDVGRKRAVDRDYAVAHFGETLEAVNEWLSVVDVETGERFLNDVRRPLRGLRRETTRISKEAVVDPESGDE
jgi:hypothetical protein